MLRKHSNICSSTVGGATELHTRDFQELMEGLTHREVFQMDFILRCSQDL
jgi:hypothetical protein